MDSNHSHDDILHGLEQGQMEVERLIHTLEELEKDMHEAEAMPNTLGPPRDNDTGPHYPGLG